MYSEVDSQGRQFSALVVLKRGDEFLLLLRPVGMNIKFPNMWSFPGGGSEKGEEPLQTAIREVYEETGLRVYPQDLKILYQTKDPDDKKNVYFFACEKWEGKIDQNKVKSEHQKSEWVKLSDMKNYKMPPNNLNLMKRLVNKRLIGKKIKLVIRR